MKEMQDKFSPMFSLLNIDRDQDLISILNDVHANVSNILFERNLVPKLANWPEASERSLICDRNSESDKMIRASAIFSIFLANHVHDGVKPVEEKKVLDYGCGDKYVIEQVRNAGAQAIGYDIVSSEGVITDFSEIEKNAPYDLILLYDVLDHAETETPVEILLKVKNLLTQNGKIVVRCHPWCSRHGTHMWSLNKAFAHLVFTEEELKKMGHEGIPTIKIVDPDNVYPKWFAEAGLRVTHKDMVYQQSGPIFENNPDLKTRLLTHFKEVKFGYNIIEQVFRDFRLEI